MDTFTSHDGTPIACVRQGAGPPVVLVHGILSDHRMLVQLAARLSDRFTVHVIDRRGRGGSGPPKTGDLAEQCADVAALLATLDEPAHLFGHSLGAWVAIGAALESDRVRTLTVYEPPPSMPMLAGMADQLDALVEAAKPEEAVTTLLGALGAPETMVKMLMEGPMGPLLTTLAPTLAPDLRMLAAASRDPRVGSLAIPVWLMRGTKSAGHLRSECDALAAAIASSRIVELEGRDHFTPTFAPSAVAEAWGPLLDEPQGEGAQP